MRKCLPHPGGESASQPSAQADESQLWTYDADTHTLRNSGMCLSSAGSNSQGRSSGCAHIAVCNTSSPSQRWQVTAPDDVTHSGWLRALDPAACSGPSPPGCCAGVTNNRDDAGAWLNVNVPCGPEPSRQQFILAGQHLLNVDSMLCAAATPWVPPSPSPSPPSPPSPPSSTPILSQIEVETLRLNQPYSPLPFMAYIQPTSLGPDSFSTTGPDPR